MTCLSCLKSPNTLLYQLVLYLNNESELQSSDFLHYHGTGDLYLVYDRTIESRKPKSSVATDL